MDWTKYSTLIKRLTILPLIVGILGIAEQFIPNKHLRTVVVDKSESYRLKTNTTTYTIAFEGIDDQFSEEIYNYIKIGDTVDLELTYFNEQVMSIHQVGIDMVYDNDTGEWYAVLGFSIAFILAGLLFFKKGIPKKWQLKAGAILTIFSIISGLKMFFG